MASCWNCDQAVAARFCGACGALQPPTADFYAFFEIPRRLSLDSKDMERRYYALSRQLHPDLFSRRSAREREYALEASAVLNDAWRTLKDPVKRALYVLRQEGFDIAEQGTKDVPAELLEEVFELNMALEELKSGDEDARPQIAAAHDRFIAMRDEIDQDLQRVFAEWDASQDRAGLDQVRARLNKRKYITNLIARTESANVSD